MTNQEALELLAEFTETASRAVQTSVWATAYLTEGGEGTWDAVKSVSAVATDLMGWATRVSMLEESFEEITPF